MSELGALALATSLILAISSAAWAQPGVELFAKAPETPTELWDAADYLVRIGRPDQARPFLDRFLAANPDDATLLQIRNDFGVGSVLRLENLPETQGYGRRILELIQVASRRQTFDSARLNRLAGLLAASPEERVVAVGQLRPAGSHAVEPILNVYRSEGLTPQQREAVARSLGDLDRRAVPGLAATLDAPDTELAAAAAQALGRIRDPRAVPFLIAATARPEAVESPLREALDQAIAGLSTLPGSPPASDPAAVLVRESERYLLGRIQFPDGPVDVWGWNTDANAPRPETMSPADATTTLGLRFAQEARKLDPENDRAKTVELAHRIDQALRQVGVYGLSTPEAAGTEAAALAAGPERLDQILQLALEGGHGPLATAATTLIGKLAVQSEPQTALPPASLTRALMAPDRRTQFAAARSLVELKPSVFFPGSSRVVPMLSRFLVPYSAPRAVVMDANLYRANELAATLHGLGYETEVARTGPDAFRLASEKADVELIFIEPTAFSGPWRLADTIANLRADARTAGLPIFLNSIAADVSLHVDRYTNDDPLTEFIIVSPDLLAFQTQLDRAFARMGSTPLTDAERNAFTRDATRLLAQVARDPTSPFARDLDRAAPALREALSRPEFGDPASVALSEIPSIDAQRDLADAALDPSRPTDVRLNAARQLARSIQRFGPLLTNTQEQKLVALLNSPLDPAIRSVLTPVYEALRRQPAVTVAPASAGGPSASARP